jgi:mannonate dehydratase
VLKKWRGFTREDLRAAFARFLAEVVPAAQELGMRLCVHPDDPPRSIFGLPRVVSTEADAGWVLDQQSAPANGLTFCSGAFGAHPDNDLIAMAQRFADRIHFLHLRNVSKDPDGSFREDGHLCGDTDMVGLIDVFLNEQARRRGEGREDSHFPFRPDHGHELIDDHARSGHPGYPLIGRMRGLAELRGAIAAVAASKQINSGP